MTKLEVSELLTRVFAYERRSGAIGHVDVEAWYPLLRDVDPDAAKAAVERHFAESGEYLTVARLRALVAVAGSEPLTAEEALRIPAADPDDVPAWLEALRAGRFADPPTPGAGPPGGLNMLGVGRKVPGVSAEEVEDDQPRPRRWWLPRRSKEEPDAPKEITNGQ